MVISGTILQVRETWPLQLVVDAEQRRYEVTLRVETRVLRHGVDVDPGTLRPGYRVEISGDGGASSMTAATIVIS